MKRLDGQVAVVTGGANGIGRETALRFLAEGARVVVADVNEANAVAVLDAAAARGHGGAIRFVRADVSRESDVEAAVQGALDHFGRLDCVFNNAGVGGAFGPIADTRLEDWEATQAVLLRGVFLGLKHGARALRAQGRGGSIVSTTSVAAFSSGCGAHAYSAAKAAVVSLTRTVAVELAPYRIRVNAVAPGPVMTDLFHRGKLAEAERNILRWQAWPEAGHAGDVASVVVFLASADAGFVTGQTIVVDGGLLARGPGVFEKDGESRFFKAAGFDRGSTGQASDVRALGG